MIKVELTIPSTGCKALISMDPETLISPHFRLVELANNKGSKNIAQYAINADTGRFMANMEAMRERYGKPINLNSCYRQPAYNLSVGGDSNSLHAPTSSHSGGLAVDWRISTDDALFNQIWSWWQVICSDTGHVPGINRYTNRIHLSYDERLLGYTDPQLRDYRGTYKD